MKRVALFIVLALPLLLTAQNFQVHYDFGNQRNYVTTTFEMFKTDKWGNTFIFTDIDYNFDKEKHPSLAYMEVARCFTLFNTPFSAQIEYNGGLLADANNAFAINNSYLAGLDYGWHSTDFSKFLNFKVLYKYIQGKNKASFQLTGVWTLNYFKDKLTLSGFADFWREDNVNFINATGHVLANPTNSKFVFMTEPQIWYNTTPHLAVGSEVEIATNFGGVAGVKVCPTVGVKWTF